MLTANNWSDCKAWYCGWVTGRLLGFWHDVMSLVRF